jgi:hypothetical protein
MIPDTRAAHPFFLARIGTDALTFVLFHRTFGRTYHLMELQLNF